MSRFQITPRGKRQMLLFIPLTIIIVLFIIGIITGLTSCSYRTNSCHTYTSIEVEETKNIKHR